MVAAGICSLRLRLSSLLLGFCLSCGGAWAGPALDRIKQTGTITVGYRESAVPFSYLDDKQKPVGYAMDLCERLVEAVRKQLQLKSINVKYRMVTPVDRIAMIEQHNIDMECGATVNSADRRMKVAFTVPHYISGTRYVVRSDSKINDLRDFEGKKLSSTEKTTPLSAIKRANQERLLGIKIVEVPDHSKGMNMVENGDADGFAMLDVLLYGLIIAKPDPDQFKVVGKFLTIEPSAIMLSKDDPELKQIFDEEMKRLIATREAHALYDRWFLKPIPPRGLSLGVPMSYLLKDFWKYPSDQVPY
ncbi:MAG: amino acid ABC transporter substrate-binding protein [Burkholderiales bacterium]